MRLAALGALLLAVYAATLSIPATAGERLRGRRAAPPARRPLVGRGRRPRPREPVRASASGASSPRASCGRAATLVLGRLREPQGVGMPLAISPGVRARRAARGRADDRGADRARVRAGGGARAAHRARAVGERAPCWWPASRRPRWRPPPPSRPSRSPRRCSPGRRCARCGCASARGCATPTPGRCCWRCCRGWTRRWPSPGCRSRSASCAGRSLERRRLVALITAELMLGSRRVLRAAQRDAVRRAAAVGAPPRPRRTRRASPSGRRTCSACGWTRRPGCCAGRPCSRSRSSARGCSRARGASTSPPRSRRGARPSASPSCSWRRSPRSG